MAEHPEIGEWDIEFCATRAQTIKGKAKVTEIYTSKSQNDAGIELCI